METSESSQLDQGNEASRIRITEQALTGLPGFVLPGPDGISSPSRHLSPSSPPSTHTAQPLGVGSGKGIALPRWLLGLGQLRLHAEEQPSPLLVSCFAPFGSVYLSFSGRTSSGAAILPTLPHPLQQQRQVRVNGKRGSAQAQVGGALANFRRSWPIAIDWALFGGPSSPTEHHSLLLDKKIYI